MSESVSLFYPYPFDTVLIDPSLPFLRDEVGRALGVANGRARVRTVKALSLVGVLSTASGERQQNGGHSGDGITSVVGCAWVTSGDGRKHVRVVGGRVFPRANVWGHYRRVEKARPEELVYPQLVQRVEGL